MSDKPNTNPLFAQPNLATPFITGTLPSPTTPLLGNSGFTVDNLPVLKSPAPPQISPAVSSFRRPTTNKYVKPDNINIATLPSVGSLPSPYGVTSPMIPPNTPQMDGSVSFNDPSSVADIPFGVTPTTFMTPTPIKEQPPSFEDGPYSVQIPASFQSLAENPHSKGQYHPVIPHWFYSTDGSKTWKPFSFMDSMNLEEEFRSGKDSIVSTDGGRFDVSVKERWRKPVYWEGESKKVRRCSWFMKSALNPLPEPYEEALADRLEEEYKNAMLTGNWHRQIELEDGGRIMINSTMSMHHYPVEPFPTHDSQTPLVIKRGADDFEISEGESDQVDHLLFVVHGIGSVCDLSFRPVEDCVDDFRLIGEQLISTHFKQAFESGTIGRVEILPISWHKALHGDATGLDERLKPITLRSIPKLREFTNDTVLDVLFYTSPVYCQLIMDTVSSEINKTLTMFKTRHPEFTGGISLGGHSLGSVILFDLLMHQKPSSASGDEDELSKSEDLEKPVEETLLTKDSSGTSSVDFKIGAAGTGQPSIKYPELSFKPEAFFLFGSPVAMFITVRGLETLGKEFKLPTCERVYNIFHPFDPVAYRLETLIDPQLTDLRPSLIPHHKGRKRLHLELKDTIERVGLDLKHKIVGSIYSTWNMVSQIYSGKPNHAIEDQLDQAVEEQMSDLNLTSSVEMANINADNDVQVGLLNGGRRIDYVLQEKPYESFTEYLFALQAHLTYWRSEDTMLLILSELYGIQGILPDSKLVQKESAPTSPPAFNQNTFITTSLTQPITEPPKPSDQQITFFSPGNINQLSPSGTNSPGPPLLGARPKTDPLQITNLGMDPTVKSGPKSIGPPPTIPIAQSLRKNSGKMGGV